MNRTELKEIIKDQETFGQETQTLTERELFAKVESNIKNLFIIILTGLRRVGKSTLLQQIRKKFPGYYLNFDDDRLIHFTIEDFQLLYELFLEMYGEKDFFYFDEVQNVSGWERFVRRLHDQHKKVFVTGSNASLLSKELGTHLTGRHLAFTLYPFSFKEFLHFKNFTFSSGENFTTEKKAQLKKYLEEYLPTGGLPEFLRTENNEYLKTLYQNILYRDIVVRYRLPQERPLKELMQFIASNVGKEISFNSLKKMLQLGSSTTVKEYFEYLENSFLVFLANKYNYSLKKQIYATKKIYFIDNALAIHLGFRVSQDAGRLLENLVFLELKRREKEVYFFRGKQECDFLIKEGTKITGATQVSLELRRENEEREIKGLLEALTYSKLKEGIILTFDEEKELVRENKKIFIVPVWKWLLGE